MSFSLPPKTAVIGFLTTKSTEWSLRRRQLSTQWINHGNGYHVELGEKDEPPLKYQGFIAPATGGSVERHHCTKIDKEVAVKRLQTHSNPETNRKLRDEVKILRMLQHYHVVQVYGSYIHQDCFNILMVPVATCNLRTYLQEPASSKVKMMERAYGARILLLPKIMGCLAHGLKYLHTVPKIRHKDIKPANILLEGPRVLFADFGCSKVFTDTQSGTTGPTSKTPMYTSPEVSSGAHRNKSSDIFSLACVFAEIFTVYKGRTSDEFYSYRRQADPQEEGYFCRTIPAVIEWLDGLAMERCDVQIIHLLSAMFNEQPEHRPDAEQVWKVLTTCTSNTKKHFCGPCCMPLLNNDPLITREPESDPSKTEYASSMLSKNIEDVKSVPVDLHFRPYFEWDESLEYYWVRNVRHWKYTTLDVVTSYSSPDLLARKRITTKYSDGTVCATTEAEILRQVHHRHVVTLHSTYRQGDVHALLFQPAADCDLRTYLELTELQNKSNGTLDLPLYEGLLIKIFGCLASALASVHAAGYDHGNIGPRNILIHNGIVFLSKFSLGLKIESGSWGGGNQQPGTYRFIDYFGSIGLGRQSSHHDAAMKHGEYKHHPRPESAVMGKYKPPEWHCDKQETVGKPSADIFSLGCVFVEIYTVLMGRRIRDFQTYRARNGSKTAYRFTLAETLEWLSELDKEDYEDRAPFQSTLRRMINSDPAQRPSAEEVLDIMQQCKTREGLIHCGAACCHQH